MTQISLSNSIDLDSNLDLSNYDEAVDGDISNDPENPSKLLLSPGTTFLSASTGDEDLEYLTVNIPDGFQLDSLVLESISPERNVAFVAVQEGDKFTEPLNRETTEIDNLLGYNLFGEPRQIGTDILDDIGDGFGAIGFEGALPGGEYTFVLRQAGVVSDYTLAFNLSNSIDLDSNLDLSNYDEAVDGDISNDPENPSELLLSPGTTFLSASTGDEDLEYLTVNIPDGFQLDSLVLESISPERNVAFVAVQEGDKFTEPLNRETTEIDNLLGYNLFGEPRQIGTDILDDIGDGFGAIGF